MSLATVLLIAAAIALVAWLQRQIRTFNTPETTSRPDRHLPADEYRLLGDDYRECVAPYFTERFISDTRNRFAVMAVTGADPEKSESRDVAAPGSLTSKEFDHAGTSK